MDYCCQWISCVNEQFEEENRLFFIASASNELSYFELSDMNMSRIFQSDI
jgi:hypothetical protein